MDDGTGMMQQIGHQARCYHCKIRERDLSPAGTKLRLCGGCSLAKYCTKACQKAAWPDHRNGCRSGVSEQHSMGLTHFAGYPAPIALTQAVTDWADGVHYHSFETLANATVLSHGGIAANMGPRALMFGFAPGVEVGGTGNPAIRFRIEQVSTLEPAAVDRMGGSWDRVKKESRKMTQYFRRKSPERRILGCIPALSKVAGATVVTVHFYPVYALECGLTSALPVRARAVCEDVADMCTETINSGRVMTRGVDLKLEHRPYVGIMVPKKKTWEWQALDGWEWAPPGDVNTKSGLHLSQVWALRAQI